MPQPLVIDLNDSALRVFDGEHALASEPGYAQLNDQRVVAVGQSAASVAKRHPRQIHNDFWHRLSAEPLPGSRLSRADLASAQIAALLPATQFAGRDAVVVVPSYLDRSALALLLGILNASQLRTFALVDSAVAATRERYIDQAAVHIELGLHCAWVARLHQTRDASSLEDVRSLEGSGLTALSELWLKFFAGQFVRQCRFDPLHSAESEQALSDALPAWLATLSASPTASLGFDAGGQSYTIDITQVDIVNAVAVHYQRIADMLRALLAGGDKPALQMRLTTSGLPGFTALLAARVGGQFFAIPDDAYAAGAAARFAVLSEDATRVQKSLPTEGEQRAVATERAASGALPTHALLAERAFVLSAQPLVIGAGGANVSGRFLQLDGAPAGVSGLHCEIVLRDGQCMLTDHSRYGTFLNGNKITGSAALQAGDLLRIGTPGVELQLAREETL